MPFQLYNTLTGKKEEFQPIRAGEARMYHCGPTVYNYAHIGNLRSYVFADTVRRVCEFFGYAVQQVINITDIGHLSSDSDEGEDKMVRALAREGKPMTLEAMREVAEKYERAFREDLAALNIKTDGTKFPRASEHIPEDIALIKEIEERNAAYRTRDGIYFDTSKFPAYGARGGFALGELREGARVAANDEKRNPRDFALWKFSAGAIGWESPWGCGFPGWHIECSAMSRRYLNQPFDIHTGGIDHISVHHQNEIAQSETAHEKPLANYWLHNEHLIMPTGKMAKSGENFITLRTLKERGIHPLAFRYYLLQTHYRTPLNFSWEALGAAQNAYFNLVFQFIRLPNEAMVSHPLADEIKYRIGDDLNTLRLLALLRSEFEEFSGSFSRNTVKDIDKVLGLDIENQSKKLADEMNAVPEDIKTRAAAREDARREKDFTRADSIREEITSAGYTIMDTDAGPVVLKTVSRNL